MPRFDLRDEIAEGSRKPGKGNLPPLPWRERAELEGAEGHPLQSQHLVSSSFHEAPDLAILALDQSDQQLRLLSRELENDHLRRAQHLRGVEMFRKLEVPVLGIVENMSWYVLPDGGRAYPFGRDGGVRLAADYDVPVLAQVPLRDGIREAGDNGRPAVLDGEAVFTAMAEAVGRALPV